MTCTCVLTAFRPSFPHLETFKKILENSTLSRYVKKKISQPTDPIFKFWSGEGNIIFFFFWPYSGQRWAEIGGMISIAGLTPLFDTQHRAAHTLEICT